MAVQILEQEAEQGSHGDSAVAAVSEPCSCGLALAGHGEAYNEEAFHHFLAIERKRSEASTRPFLLLLVEFEKSPPDGLPLDRDLAGRIFGALAQSLRDTDVIGWYRDHRIAGAVLTDLGEEAQTVGAEQITERVQRLVRQGVQPQIAPFIRVRVYQIPARTETVSAQTSRTGPVR